MMTATPEHGERSSAGTREPLENPHKDCDTELTTCKGENDIEPLEGLLSKKEAGIVIRGSSTISVPLTDANIFGTKWQIWKCFAVLTFVFWSQQAAYLPTESLQSSLNGGDSSLGVVSLATMYTLAVLSGLVSPAVLQALTPKYTLLSIGLTVTAYIASKLLPKMVDSPPCYHTERRHAWLSIYCTG